MEIQNRIAKLNKDIRQAENMKLQAETRLEALGNQYEDINKKFTELGINPKDANKEKERLEKLMAKKEEEINKLLPHDSIKNYK